MKDIMINSSKKYAKGNALGTIVKEKEKASFIAYKSYAQFFE